MVIVGNAGRQLGDYLVRGAIYIKGECKSLGHNTKIEKPSSEDLNKLSSIFEKYDIKAKPEEFKKIVPISKSPFG